MLCELLQPAGQAGLVLVLGPFDENNGSDDAVCEDNVVTDTGIDLSNQRFIITLHSCVPSLAR